MVPVKSPMELPMESQGLGNLTPQQPCCSLMSHSINWHLFFLTVSHSTACTEKGPPTTPGIPALLPLPQTEGLQGHTMQPGSVTQRHVLRATAALAPTHHLRPPGHTTQKLKEARHTHKPTTRLLPPRPSDSAPMLNREPGSVIAPPRQLQTQDFSHRQCGSRIQHTYMKVHMRAHTHKHRPRGKPHLLMHIMFSSEQHHTLILIWESQRWRIVPRLLSQTGTQCEQSKPCLLHSETGCGQFCSHAYKGPHRCVPIFLSTGARSPNELTALMEWPLAALAF